MAMREMQEVGTGPGAVLGVPKMGMPDAVLARTRHSVLGLHPKQSEADAWAAKRMNAGQGSGPAAVGVAWPYVGHHF